MNEILHVETESCNKDWGKVYSRYESDEELSEPIPEKPIRPSSYHVVYRSFWDMICGRPIEVVLERNAKKTYDEWVARKKAEQNRKSYDFR